MATIIIKVTEKCNSNCRYCDVVRKENTGKTMSLDIIRLLFQRTNEYLLDNPDETLDFLWHGGEPLLPGAAYYKHIIDFQKNYCPDTGNRISHSIQTNLTCFTEEFVSIFNAMGIKSVGTSYDPEPHMRGPGKNIDTLSYNKKFIRALKILDKYDIGWGMIYVVTGMSLKDPLGVFYFLTNFLLTGGVNFNPVLIYDEERKYLSVTPVQFVEFLGAIFPVWWENRNRYPDVEPFKSLVNNIIHGHRSLACVDSGSCTYHHINISPEGDTSQCGRSSDWKLLDYGNIRDSKISEILRHPERDQLEKRNRILMEGECAGCRFWEICHGGCPLDAWSKHRDFNHKSEWCYAKKGFIEKYFEPVTGSIFKP
ncbi:MAG: radical SAM protein [Bacteroidales bacterium]|nr:radical SAM protein [Bacteroidales bacterium]